MSLCPEHRLLVAQIRAVQAAAKKTRNNLNRTQRPGKNPLLKALNYEISWRSTYLGQIEIYSSRACGACEVVALYRRVAIWPEQKSRDVLQECLRSST